MTRTAVTVPLLALAVTSALAAPVAAAPVSVAVRGPGGAPLAGAVVTVEVPGTPAPPLRGPYRVEQRDIAFQPDLLIVPVGATVAFPNRDKVRHHVYSFSAPKRFDLKLYGREDQRSVTFDKPGPVALGCNIHDRMNGVIYVTPTPFAGRTNAAGRIVLASVPAGRATVRVWHPAIRASGNSLVQPVTVTPAGLSTTLTVQR